MAVVHRIENGEAVTSCCGRTPFDLPRSDRITVDDQAACSHNLTRPVAPRNITGVHHADDCPMRNPDATGCICGREGERSPGN